MQIPEDFLPDDSMDDLVEAAVGRILMASGLDDFLPWFSDEVHRLFRSERITLDTRETRALATQFGRSIWGATTAPHNDFRPQPLPKPGRNAPCHCGSGEKYKNCCARFPALPPMSPAEVWPAVLDALPQRDCRQVVESGRVPVDSLVNAAEESRFVRDSRRAIGFLEPIFGEKLAGTGGQHGYALTLLCDLYDDAGWTRKKTALLDRIITEVPRSELRSDAFQRMATIRMDQNDLDGAWDAFRRAQRDTPGDPSVGLLEVNLHIAQNQPEQARESAVVWRKGANA